MKEKTARTWTPRLGLELPGVLLPDIRDLPTLVRASKSRKKTRISAQTFMTLVRTYQTVVQGKCPLNFLHFNGVVCSNALFSKTSALTTSLLFQANSKCKESQTPCLVEQFWVPILGASCSNKLFVGTLRPSQGGFRKTSGRFSLNKGFGVFQGEDIACDTPPPSLRAWGARPAVQEGYVSDTWATPREARKIDATPPLQHYLENVLRDVHGGCQTWWHEMPFTFVPQKATNAHNCRRLRTNCRECPSAPVWEPRFRLSRRTVSRRDFCDTESLAKR